MPLKNIDPIVADVRGRGTNHDPHLHRPVVHLEHEPQRPGPGTHLFRRIFVICVTTVVVLIIGFGVILASDVYRAQRFFSGRGEEIVNTFLLSLETMGQFEQAAAEAHLEQNRETVAALERFLGERRGSAFTDLVGGVVPALRGMKDLLNDIAGLNQNFVAFSEALDEIRANAFLYFLSDGEKLRSVTARLESIVHEIKSQTRDVKNETAALRSISPFFATIDETIGDQYVKRSSELASLERFLGGVREVIGREEDQHFLLAFLDPATLRPSGGLSEAFAHLTVRRGQFQAIDAQSTALIDKELETRVIPPSPLWTIVDRWGAHDANWFFDFPLSARASIGFLEASRRYREQGIQFEGVAALSIEVMGTLLKYAGPTELSSTTPALTPENVSNEIRRNSTSTLTVLLPHLFERLRSLPPPDTAALMSELGRHIHEKNIQFFAKSAALADFFAAHSIDGSVRELPNDFWGSYLGVANANVGGGTSDAYITQRIDTRIDIDTNGGALTDLSIQRAHAGATQNDRESRTTNQNYLQIFVNPGSQLIGMTGNEVKTILPQVDYTTSSFVVHPDLETIESSRLYSSSLKAWTGSAFGKTVFSTWVSLPAGRTRTFETRYQTPDIRDFSVVPGKVFTFVFDRQSGVHTSLKVTILAPIGYTWVESDSPIFSKEFPDPAAREVVTLTLAK